MKVFILSHGEARRRASAAVMDAPEGYRVTVTAPNRTSEQNAKFHALCSDIAKRCQWLGKQRTPEQWKVLLVSGHAVATKEGAEVVPGLEGEFVNIRESTALMSKSRGSSLIEYTLAFAASQGVELAETADGAA
jgi:hypothetical protein